MNELTNISDIQKVSCPSLFPSQQVHTATKILRSADCYQQRFIKFDGIGIFHSYAELLHAALLEANPFITSFTPQPLSLRINKRRYIPDCYFVKSGKRFVVELKPLGEFNDELKIPLTAFFKFNQIQFEVISNESVLEKEVIARNWLQIIRTLLSARYEDTQAEELTLWNEFIHTPEKCIGDIVCSGDRINRRNKEIALYRLIHRGKFQLNFNGKEIGFNSEVSLCN